MLRWGFLEDLGKSCFSVSWIKERQNTLLYNIKSPPCFLHFCSGPSSRSPRTGGVLAVSGSSASAHSYFKTGDESFPGDTSSCSWGCTQDPSLSKGLRGGGDRCHLPAITAMGQPQPCSPKKPTYFTHMPTAHEAPKDVGKLCPGCSSRQASDCTFVPRELPVTWDGNGPGCSELQPRAWGCCRL